MKIKEVFVCILMNCSILFTSCTADILSELWRDENSHLELALRGMPIPEKENKILVSRLSELPFTELIKSDVWYELLRYRTIESLDVNDWQTYEPLIPYLPLSMLRKVNFTNDLILAYFGQQKLSQYQLPQLAEEAALRSSNVFDSEEEILKLGNIFCGFTATEMSMIKEPVLRSLLEKNFFRSVKACTPAQLNYLSKLVKEYKVLGPPRTWRPEIVKQAGSLIAGLRPCEIREIREKNFSQITPEVIPTAPLESLRVMKDSQLKTLNRTALLSWRRKTRDLRGLYMSRALGYSAKISFASVLPFYLTVNWKGVNYLREDALIKV